MYVYILLQRTCRLVSSASALATCRRNSACSSWLVLLASPSTTCRMEERNTVGGSKEYRGRACGRLRRLVSAPPGLLAGAARLALDDLRSDREDASSLVTAGEKLTPRRGTVAHLGNQGGWVHIHTGNLSGVEGRNTVGGYADALGD